MTHSRPTLIALIPARSGSLRVRGKNIRPLAGHPMIAYSIAAAKASGLFQRIIVSTDSELYRRIAEHYGAEAPFLRPMEFATSTSPDIEWIKHCLENLNGSYDAFAKLNPTSPFRMPTTIQRAWEQFLSTPDADSLRAVELCHEHPGKMWVVGDKFMSPFIDQSDMEVAWHARQYQDLPKVYIQNSSLEIVWTRVVRETNTREGKRIIPFFTEKAEGFSIDYEHDWILAEHMIQTQSAILPKVEMPAWTTENERNLES